MNKEKERLISITSHGKLWRKWGPYLTDRQWGTVREDYSPNGDAWDYISHDQARSKAFRWGEEGIGGISDDLQLICFSCAFWNKKDPILKERFFGVTNSQGNHGEDVKEYYYFLDNTPTHSYMKMLYKYPQAEFPYSLLLNENKKRTKDDPEYELIDTGIFNEDKYFDIFIEYAKSSEEDILINITAHNRGKEKAPLYIIPQIWFRNRWDIAKERIKPELSLAKNNSIKLIHHSMGEYILYYENNPEVLFCENETNNKVLYNTGNKTPYLKDGINDYITGNVKSAVNPALKGTKAACSYNVEVEGGSSASVRLRLTKNSIQNPFSEFDKTLKERKKEADDFYSEVQRDITDEDNKNIQRQAFAGMLWCKQFYYYDVEEWLNGDKGEPPPPPQRKEGRNKDWVHLNNMDIISMPDKWEFPWYATWDLAFHCITLSMIDPEFAKSQLHLLTREWFMHPKGQFPAYEWNFSDVNPPVHAWATWRVYKIDEKLQGKPDTDFLERVFLKLLLNFTWWSNKKDHDERNIFQGGFLGLDNIGVFDRDSLPAGAYLDQADGTSWMAMFSLNMLRISLELSKTNTIYQDIATHFFEQFLYIAQSMTNMGGEGFGLWDEEDGFYYDALHLDGKIYSLKLRSMVGIIPLFAVEVLEPELMKQVPEFESRLNWFLVNRPDMALLVSRWNEKGVGERRLLSLLRGHRMKELLRRMLDETEFFSEYGVRSLSKYYEQNPFIFHLDGTKQEVKYTPAESDSDLFGGNSNWRGPIWFQVNFLIIESLHRFHHYYGDDFKIECPTHSGKFITIKEVADELAMRLSKIFVKDKNSVRPVFGYNQKIQTDPHFKDYILFHEYFDGDNGRGVGASHQTGWTGLIAKILQPRRK